MSTFDMNTATDGSDIIGTKEDKRLGWKKRRGPVVMTEPLFFTVSSQVHLKQRLYYRPRSRNINQ